MNVQVNYNFWELVIDLAKKSCGNKFIEFDFAGRLVMSLCSEGD
jgi:hypothetical protein